MGRRKSTKKQQKYLPVGLAGRTENSNQERVFGTIWQLRGYATRLDEDCFAMNQNSLSKAKFSVHQNTQPRDICSIYSSTEDYLRQNYTSQPTQGFHQFAPSLPSAGSSSHDMNKQQSAATAGLYSSPSGAIPGPAPQHHQPGLGGPVSSQQPTPLVQTQGQQINPRIGLTGFYARQNTPRPMSNLSRQPLTGVVSQSAPQAPQQYGTQLQNVMFSSHPPFHPSMTQNTVIIPSAVPVSLNRPQYAGQQQYTVSPSQQAVYLHGASWGNYSGPPQMFYSPQMHHMASSCPPPSMQHIGQIPNVPATKNDKKSNRIPIINPKTGKDVLEEIESNPPPTPGSKENTVEAPHSNDVVIQFAAQVAAVASVSSKKDVCKPSVGRSYPVDMEDEQQSVQSEDLNLLENTEEAGGREIENQGICESYKHEEEAVVNNEDSTLSFLNKDVTDINSIETEEVLFPDENEKLNSPNLVNPIQVPEVEEPSEPATVNAVVEESNNDYLSVACRIDAQQVLSEVVSLPDENRDLPIVEYDSEVKDKQIIVEEEKTLLVEKNSLKLPPMQKQQIPQKIRTQQNCEISESNTIATTNTITKEEKSSNEAKEGKKGSKNKKKKDLNKKGESKEGGDMDAFLDKTEEVVPVPSATTASPPSTIAVPDTIPKAESPVPIVQNSFPNSLPLQDGELEKLEENNQGSDASDELIVLPSMENDAKRIEDNSVQDTPKQITLKYSYKEDQWSPLNPEGKKQYDREFLLQLQSQPMSLRKPLNLPNLDVIRDKAVLHRLSETNRVASVPVPARTYTDPFMPNYARTGASRPPHPGISRRTSQGRDKPKKVIAFSSSLNQAVKLHEADNAWKPSLKQTQAEIDDMEEGKIQDLYKRVRGILNKLTPQKFQTLVGQVKQLKITTEERLNGVIDLVFEKAIDEPNFSVPYANMCKQLALLKVPSSGQEGQFVNFRKLLLTKCQREFEQDRSDEIKREERMKSIEECETAEKRKQLQEDFEEEERKNRRRQLGNIRFIGELFKLGMLIEPIMHECIKKLLNQGDEDSLECLCRLLTTIGKELENDKTKRDNSLMDSYFTDMQKTVDKRHTSSRVRFMLQDVIDLRKKNWIPRRDENNPKTIDQIHKEAEREAHEQQQMLQQIPFPKRIPDDRDRRKGRGNPNYEDGWITSNKSKGSYSVDPMKLKLTKPAEVENIQLGPGGRGFSSWGRGSSGGTKTTAQEQEAKSAVLTNRYSALAEPPSTPIYEARRGSQRSAASSRESSRGRSNQLPPPSIRKTPSTSKEREQLLETVKDFTRTGAPEQKPAEIKKVPETSREINGKDSTALLLKGPELSEEDIEKKTKPLIDEFLHNSDFEEALRCVMELASPATVSFFISSAINQVLERSSQARYLLGQLLHNLIRKGVLSMEQYNKGMKAVLELVDDYALDIPMIWEYLGEIIEPMLEDTTLSLKFLRETLQPCVPSLTAGKLVSAVLHCAAKKRGTIKVGEMWRESGLKWTDFLKRNDDVMEFVKSHKLEFTVSQTETQPNAQLSAEEIKKRLVFYLQKVNGDNEEIFDWIEANVGENRTKEPQFIRALVTAVHENAITGEGGKCELEQKKVKQRMPLLQRFLDHREHLELQALYALQALMNQLHHPKGVLRQIFDILYDEDLISEDAFKQWEYSKDSAEQEGKGVALLSVGPFFTWLREADEESTEEDN